MLVSAGIDIGRLPLSWLLDSRSVFRPSNALTLDGTLPVRMFACSCNDLPTGRQQVRNTAKQGRKTLAPLRNRIVLTGVRPASTPRRESILQIQRGDDTNDSDVADVAFTVARKEPTRRQHIKWPLVYLTKCCLPPTTPSAVRPATTACWAARLTTCYRAGPTP